MRKATRTNILTIRLSNYELEELNRIILETNQSTSSFIRNAMLEKIQRIDFCKEMKKEDKKRI